MVQVRQDENVSKCQLHQICPCDVPLEHHQCSSWHPNQRLDMLEGILEGTLRKFCCAELTTSEVMGCSVLLNHGINDVRCLHSTFR